MKHLSAKMNAFLVVLFTIISTTVFSQNIAINLSGNPSTNPTAILDLADASNNTLGLLLPNVFLSANNTITPFTSTPATGLIVWNTNAAMTGGQGVGFYYWSGSGWLYILNTGVASSSGWGTTGNASTVPGTNYAGTSDSKDFVLKTNATERMRFMSTGAAGVGTATPKSSMDVNGNMSLGAYAGVTAAPSNGMIISGQMGIGNSTPAASSVLDLTNTLATGGTGAAFRWPTNPNPSANIASPVLGDEVYNTTTGCFNFYNGAAWVVVNCPCSAGPAIPVITPSCPFALQGTTITYTSSVTSGVTFTWTVTSTVGAPIVTGLGTSSITVTWPSSGAGTGTVSLYVTNACGTSTATPLSVPLYANPTMTIANPVSVSSTGNAYSVPSMGGATYAWTFVTNTDASSIVGSGNAITVTAGSNTGTYSLQCVVSFGSCSYTVTSGTITVSCPTYAGSITGPSPINISTSGNAYTVTTLAGATYAWSFSTALAGCSIVGSGSSITVTTGSTGGTFVLKCIVTLGTCSWTVISSTITVSACSHGSQPFSFNGGSNYSGSAQSWTIPACVTQITITASGGSGAANVNYSFAGGYGAIITSPAIAVTGSHVIKVIVAGAGATGSYGGGGGGASYVWDFTSNTLLLVAGGGGGGGYYSSAGYTGANGQTNTASLTTPNTAPLPTGYNGAGGTGGAGSSGGIGGSDCWAGGGGAGWGENGFTATASSGSGYGGLDPANGGTGGTLSTSSYPAFGGFGGGGCGVVGGGGGGGYNGGGGGGGCYPYGGGGGGASYCISGTPTTSATNSGNGSVTITW